MFTVANFKVAFQVVGAIAAGTIVAYETVKVLKFIDRLVDNATNF